MIFVFKTVANVEQIICDTVQAIGGKVTSRKDNVITAHWRTRNYMTVLSNKFKFYIGEDVVRVTCGNSGSAGMIVIDRNKGGGLERAWMEFVEKLVFAYPHLDFGIKGFPIKLESVKMLTNGIESVMSTTAFTNHHFFIPDLTYATSRTKSQFSKELLANAVYSNGLVVDGTIIRNSAVYNHIMANMSKYEKR